VTGERGLGLVELLVAVFAASVVLLGLATMYLGSARVFGESTARAALQRQGSLAVEEIGRRARTATPPNAISLGCNARPVSVRINGPSGPICYYPGPAGELCEDTGAGCRDLLANALQGATPGVGAITLKTQATPAEPACPAGVAPGQRCFAVDATGAGQRCFAGIPGDTRACVAFAITDGLHDIAFEVALTCAGRNC
jgi:hypothetical protein